MATEKMRPAIVAATIRCDHVGGIEKTGPERYVCKRCGARGHISQRRLYLVWERPEDERDATETADAVRAGVL